METEMIILWNYVVPKSVEAQYDRRYTGPRGIIIWLIRFPGTQTSEPGD